jgi:hypothetical protein
MKNITMIVAAAVSIGSVGSPATAREAAAAAAPVVAAIPLLQVGAADAAIVRSFRSVVGRAPSDRELVRYRALMLRYGWSESDVRNDLRARTDYRKYRNDTGTRPNAAIRSAYLDILGREPDPEGLRNYRQRMAREGWSEQDVREALRNSAEFAAVREASAERIVRRAYLDVLKREPDPEGLAAYKREVIENGWEYHDVRVALARSPERRQRRVEVRESDAREMVRRAYLSVLNREPDASGMDSYVAKIVRDRWTEADVVRALRDSEEYRRMRR